jgi:hypothetical protein
MTLDILRTWGSVTEAECPYPRVEIAGRRVVPGALYNNIYAAWGVTRADPTMKIAKWHTHSIPWERPDALNKLRMLLAGNEPLVFGSHLPKGWKTATFDANGRPWEKYGELARKSNGALSGHAMLIIGYDDDVVSEGGQQGAILIQNSWGPDWGMSWEHAFKRQYPNLPVRSHKGYAWITYRAFRKLMKHERVFSIDI